MIYSYSYMAMPSPILILLAILLPPAAVYMVVGLTVHFWINIALTLLGYVPGIIHAFWILFTF